MSTKLVTVIGNVGAGKSSVISLVKKTLKAESLDADNLFQTTDPFRESYLKDIGRWSLANETWLTIQRAEMIRNALEECKSEWLVVDSGLLMSWVYTHSHLLVGEMNKEEWSLYETIFDKWARGLESDVVVWLDYSVETLMGRIVKRGRDYELSYYTPQYLNNLQLGLSALTEKLKKEGAKLVKVSEQAVPDFVVNKKDESKLKQIILGLAN